MNIYSYLLKMKGLEETCKFLLTLKLKVKPFKLWLKIQKPEKKKIDKLD